MKKIINLLLGISLMAGLFYGLYLTMNYLIDTLNSLQKEVSAAIIAGMVTIIISIISITIGKYYERKMVIEKELRDKKIPMYEEFIEFFLNLFLAEKTKDKEISEEEMVNFFNKFTQKLMVWGSDQVVGQWSDYRRKVGKNPHDTTKTMFEFEKLLLVIRKDTGHANKNIKSGDLLGLFINDIDNYIKRNSK